MDEKTLQSEGQLESVKHLISRRRLLKQAGAAGIALTAMYAAPSFSSFGPRPAYATITGSTPCVADLCDGRKAAILTLTYTGLTGDGDNSQPSDKAITQHISPGIDGQTTVDIKWVSTNDPNNPGTVFSSTDGVPIGGNFVIDQQYHGHHNHGPHLAAHTFILICDPVTGDPLQHIEFHTSCSQELHIGDTFGTMELTRFEDEDGGVDCDPSTDTSDDLCEGKVKIESLILSYQGKDDSNITQDQEGKAVVTDDPTNGPPALNTPVWIEATDKDDNYDWFTGPVTLGGTFELNPLGAARDELHAETWIRIYDYEDGPLLQTINMHTSCSKLLRVGDEFGAVTVEPGFVLV